MFKWTVNPTKQQKTSLSLKLKVLKIWGQNFTKKKKKKKKKKSAHCLCRKICFFSCCKSHLSNCCQTALPSRTCSPSLMLTVVELSPSSSTVLRQLGSLSWLKKITTHATSSPSSVYLWSTRSFCQSVKKAVRKEQQQWRSCCWHALLCKFRHIEIYMRGRFLLVSDEIGTL